MDQIINTYLAVYQVEKHIRKLFSEEAKQQMIDLTFDQWIIFETIKEKPGVLQTEIAKISNKDVAAVNRILNLMEKKQIVFSKKPKKSSIKREFYLTGNGEEQYLKIKAISKKMSQKIAKKYHDREHNLMMSLLTRWSEDI